jgi:hypothetical protein
MGTAGRNLLRILPFVFVGLMANSPQATVTDQCEPMIKGCLSKIGEGRDECLHSLLSLPSCAASRSHDILRRRSLLAPPIEEGPAFLGPRETNRSCVDSFDSEWQRSLTGEPSSSTSRRRLEEQLFECEQEPVSKLYRP